MPIGFITNLLSKTGLLEHAAVVNQDRASVFQHAQLRAMQRRSHAHHGGAAEHAYWHPPAPGPASEDRLTWLGLVRRIHKQPFLLATQRMTLRKRAKSHHGREPSALSDDGDSVELPPHTHETVADGNGFKSKSLGLALTQMVFSSAPKSEVAKQHAAAPRPQPPRPRGRTRVAGLGQWGH